MKKTPLYDIHAALNARIIPFAGFEMPVSYEGIKVEHKRVREAVGVFDVSHMGEFTVKGPEAARLIQYVTSNDVTQLYNGRIQYSCLPNGKGGIVDDLLVYQLAEDEFMLVVNASNIEKDLAWIQSHNKWDCTVEDHSENWALLAVQGPKATETLQKICDLDLAEMKYYTFAFGKLAGFEKVMISATGYTGAGGFEIYLANDQAAAVWEAVMEAGAEFGIGPAGLGSRDTLRLEKGFCLYGNDINDETSPLEAGLGWITKLKIEDDFIDKQYLIDQKSAGLKRRLVAFVMKEKGIPRQHYEILSASGEIIGEVSSGTESPSSGDYIGMGYVKAEHRAVGTEIGIQIRKKVVKAEVVKLPFV